MIVYDSTVFEFFAEPYLLKLKFNEEIVNMSSDENEKDVVCSQDSYLCRVKKMQYKQVFSGIDTPEACKGLVYNSTMEDMDKEMTDQQEEMRM